MVVGTELQVATVLRGSVILFIISRNRQISNRALGNIIALSQQ